MYLQCCYSVVKEFIFKFKTCFSYNHNMALLLDVTYRVQIFNKIVQFVSKPFQSVATSGKSCDLIRLRNQSIIAILTTEK